jgi:hypothetical protein
MTKWTRPAFTDCPSRLKEKSLLWIVTVAAPDCADPDAVGDATRGAELAGADAVADFVVVPDPVPQET